MASSLPIILLAEFLGTFLLMLSVLASGGNPLVIGATLAFIVFLTGGISGAAVNPALAAGLWYMGTLTQSKAIAYIVVEILGGLAAAYAYKIVG